MGVADLVKENQKLRENWEESEERCIEWIKKAGDRFHRIKELEKENQDLTERLSAMTQLYMNLLKHKK